MARLCFSVGLTLIGIDGTRNEGVVGIIDTVNKQFWTRRGSKNKRGIVEISGRQDYRNLLDNWGNSDT